MRLLRRTTPSTDHVCKTSAPEPCICVAAHRGDSPMQARKGEARFFVTAICLCTMACEPLDPPLLLLGHRVSCHSTLGCLPK